MLIHGSLNEQLLRSEMEMARAEAVAAGCAGAANGWMDWLINRETVLEEMAVIDKSGRFWRADSLEELVDEARRRGGLDNEMIAGLSDQVVQLVGEALAYGDFEPPVIGIAGSGPGAGKDAVADVLVAEYGYKKAAWADALKSEILNALRDPGHDYWKFLSNETGYRVTTFMERIGAAQSGCWAWGGTMNHAGYGIFWSKQTRNRRAHRFMWEVVLGNRPCSLLMHSCDRRECVNPLCLSPGTELENTRDMIEKGRYIEFLNRHPWRTLSDSNIEDVLDLFAGGVIQSEISRRLGLPTGTVSRIVNGKHRVKHSIKRSSKPAGTFRDEWMSHEHKEKFRALCQRYGMYRRNQDPDYWVKRTPLGPGSVIPGTRFRNEVAAIRAKRGVLLWVENRNIQKCDHPSENDINEQDCDITIMAGVPLDELAESVHLAMRNLRLRAARSSFGDSEAA